MTTVGTLVIDLKASVARLETDMKRASRDVKSGLDQIESAAGFAKTALATLGVVIGTQQFVGLIKGAFDSADALAKMSDRTGIAIERLAGLHHAADLAGVSHETLNTALRQMLNHVADAAQGSGEAAKGFERLGLSAQYLSQLPADEQLGLIVNALGDVHNAAARTSIAVDIFGGRATEVLNLVRDGAAGIRQATEDTLAWGVALSRIDAAKIEIANDEVTRAKSAFQGLLNTIAVELAPIVALISKRFADAAKESGGFKNEVISGVDAVVGAVGGIADTVNGLAIVWMGLKVVVAEVLNFIVQTITFIPQKLSQLFTTLGDTSIGKRIGLDQFAADYRTTVRSLIDISAVLSNRVQELIQEFDEAALARTPSEVMRERLSAFKEEMQALASASAEASTGVFAGDGAPLSPDAKGSENNERADARAKLERLRQEFLTERELVAEQLIERNAIAQAALDEAFLSDQQHALMSEQIKRQHEEKLTAIEDAELKKRFGLQQVYRKLDMQSAGFFFGQLSVLMQSNSKKQFEIGKKAAIAETIINTYQAAVKAYQSLAGIYLIGPALGAAAAGAAIAFGMAQVSRIRSQAFEGGSGGVAVPTFAANPSTGEPLGTPGGNVGQSTAGESQASSVVQVVIHGNLIGSETFVRETLVPALREEIRNRDVVIIDRGSRQALEFST